MNDWSRTTALSLLCCACLAGLAGAAASAQTLTIYSNLSPERIGPILRAYSVRTGIQIRVVYIKNGLLDRLAKDGAANVGDIVIASDYGLLVDAKARGLTAAVNSPEIAKNVPSQYRDIDGHWIGVTRRARALFVSKTRVQQTKLRYEDLSRPEWKRKICMRPGGHTYNVSLIASLIAHNGVEKTEAWLSGVRANLARRPEGNDRAQMKGVHDGQCDVAIVNTYDMGETTTNMASSNQRAWARSVRIVFPNAEGRGSHVSVSGVARLKTSRNVEAATSFIAYFTSPLGQKILAAINYEYPLHDGVPSSDLVESWGKLIADKLPLSKIARYREKARQLVRRLMFDEVASR
ncbi:MAG: extracellular solute-binding protein [Pseudomonadota bacterium]